MFRFRKTHPCRDPFARVPEQVRNRFFRFRKTHPPRMLTLDGHEWPWIAVGEGPRAVVLLHGMAGALDFWWLAIEALQDRFRLLAMTYPPVRGLEAHARGIVALMDEAGMDRAAVVGTSMGGYLAQYLVSTRAERFRAAVLGSTFPPNEHLRRQNRLLLRLLPCLPEGLIMAQMRRHTEKMIYPAAGHSELVRAMLLEQYCGRMRKAHVIARAHTVLEPFALRAEAALPVCIIESDNDPLVPPVLREQLTQAWPQAEVHTLHGAGHFGYLNRPDEYIGILADFLARHA